MDATGLEAVFINNRAALLRFLRTHGAGDAAEDLLQELWLKVQAGPVGPVSSPLAYLYRAANNLMLDRHRSTRQAIAREHRWSDTSAADEPGRSGEPYGERVLIARETLDRVQAALASLGSRAEQIFRRHRLDGVPQKQIAIELGISVSTVESDLRKATRMLVDLRLELDQGFGATSSSWGQDDERP